MLLNSWPPLWIVIAHASYWEMFTEYAQDKKKKIFLCSRDNQFDNTTICFYRVYQQANKSKSYNSLRVNMADMKFIKKINEFNPEYQGSLPAKRNYVDIVLTGNNTDNRIKLDFAQIRIREILTKNDSINGVHFHFTDDSEWWTFVESVNILYK